MSNKKVKLAVLSLIGLLGLTACGNAASADEIYNKPTNYNDPIVTINGSSDIHHDLMSIVYDQMHEGSLTTKTIDRLMYRYAESVFGIYNKVTLRDGTETTLKAAVEDALEAEDDEDYTPVVANAFIIGHKAYWNYNEEGQHVNDDGEVIPEGKEFLPGKTELKHLVSKWKAIELRIKENMFKRVKNSGNIEKNYWSETDYLKSLYFDNYKVGYKFAEGGLIQPVNLPKLIIPYTVEAEKVFEEFADGKRVLHRELYQSSYRLDEEHTANVENTYIEDVVIPEVYADLLVEQYLLDQDVAAVRNSRARKINVIKIEKYSGASGNADKLIQARVEEIYANVPDAAATSVRLDSDLTPDGESLIEVEGRELFEKYAVINKGLYDEIHGVEKYESIVRALNDQASYIYEEKDVVINGVNYTYYNNTAYGDLVKKYAKVANVTDYELLDSAEYSTFTSSGTRSIQEGFAQQLIDIEQKQTITKGWYIQNQAPSLDADGTIKDRLFKLSVANAKLEVGNGTSEEIVADNKEELNRLDRIQKTASAGWMRRAEADPDENKFLCSINGAYYLKFEDQYSGDDWWKDIVLDTDGAYYIVQVLEAVKDVKLRNLSESNYVRSRGQDFMDATIDQVAKLVGETGNYSSLSKSYWLKKMDLYYHDQKIYDYFVETYPDLFK